MATPPSPAEPVLKPPPPPAPAPAPSAPVGQACAACGAEAVVNWRRRPTDAELAEIVAAEETRREELRLLANPQLPPPQFPPLPTAQDTTRTLYACAQHALDVEPASLIHQKTCTAPNAEGQWGCDCTPEPAPKPAPHVFAETAPSRLPAHWLAAGTR